MNRIKVLVFLQLLCFASVGFAAQTLTAEQAAQQAITEGLSLPKPEADGRIQTMNKKGAMVPTIDPLSERFIATSALKNKRVLEIGSSYGMVVLESLRRGNRNFTANDLDINHLKILALEVQTKTPKLLRFLKLAPGSFPDKITFKPNYFDDILIARVLHFFTPEQINASIAESFRILKPGGHIYVVAITPYVKRFASFIPSYLEKVREGVEYPGYVTNLKDWADPSVTNARELAQLHDAPFMFLDKTVLRKVFERAGFKVEECKEFPLGFASPIWELDQREYVGLVAQKPSQN